MSGKNLEVVDCKGGQPALSVLYTKAYHNLGVVHWVISRDSARARPEELDKRLLTMELTFVLTLLTFWPPAPLLLA